LIPIDKIAFSVLHITLKLLQKFVKSLNKGSDCFQFICRSIKKSEAKLSYGVFSGHVIRLLMASKDFPDFFLYFTNKMYLLFEHKDKCDAHLGIFSDEYVKRLHKNTSNGKTFW